MASLFTLVSCYQSNRDRDPDFAAFETNYFLLGTDFGGTNQNSINLCKIRLPILKHGQKSVIDYSKLDRRQHSKLQVIAKID